MLFIGLIVLAVVVAIALFYHKQFSYWKTRNVLHLEPKFPSGNFSEVGRTLSPPELIRKIYDKFKGKDVLAGVYLFFEPGAVILDPETWKTILVRDFSAFHSRGIYYNEEADPLAMTLFELEGSAWKHLRSKLSPTFTSGKIKQMFGIMQNVANEMVDYLKVNADTGDIVEIKEVVSRFTTDVIGTCAFGVECNSLKDPNAEFRVQGQKAFDLTLFQLMKLFFATLFPNVSKLIGLRTTDTDLTNFFMKVVRETIAFRKSSETRRNDFMQLLIDLENELSFNEIVGLAFSFFSAGFETSSSAISCCLLEIAHNQDIQEKLRNEIETVIAKHDGQFTYDAILSMPYCEQVISETLRKYPPAGVVVRQAYEKYNVPNSKHVIEKGMKVFIPIYGLHRDPEIYPDPEKFDPERFN